MRLALGLLLLASSLTAQARTLRIDFGDPGNHTGMSGGQTWNDVDSANSTSPLALLDDGGVASGVQFAFLPGAALVNSNTAGTTSPAGGSPLASLAWPVSVLRDTMYGSSGNASSEFTLTGLDPSATYDVTIVASRMNVAAGDVRATEFVATGARTTTVVIDASNNDSEFVRLRGIAAGAGGALSVRIRPHSTNTNSSSFYYINGLAIDEYAAGTQAPLIGLSTNLHHVSRVAGAGPLAQSLELYTNDGSASTASLSAIDDATQSAPTWLTLPGTSAMGAFPLTFDTSSLAPGTYTATLSASATGYAGAQATLALTVRPPGGLNLLFYGNSYSQGNGGMPSLLAALAVDAGEFEPNDVARLAGGQNLLYHLTNPGQAAAITSSLPPGEEWDFVILQGHSIEATNALGDPVAFRANAVSILGNVRAHSPNARAVLFQTWARGRGHSFYQGGSPPFARPYDMHQEIESNYALAASDIDAAFGPGSALRAACGETVALLNFDPGLYDPDLAHPRPAISVMTAAAIYAAIYGASPCDVTPDFAGNSAFAQRLNGYGIDLDDWRTLASYAERVRSPLDRSFAGSGEDLFIRTATDGLLTSCARKPLQFGDTLSVSLTSPASNYSTAPAVLYFDLAPSTALPGPWTLHPEVHLGPLSATALVPLPGLGEGLSFDYTIPVTAPGWSVLLQAVSFAPSAKTGNPDFTTTDAHELFFP